MSKLFESIFSVTVFPGITEENTNEEGAVITHVPNFLFSLLANANSLTVMLFFSLSTAVIIAAASIPAVALARTPTSFDFVLLMTAVRIIPKKIKETVEMIYTNVLSFFPFFVFITPIVSISYCAVKWNCRIMNI